MIMSIIILLAAVGAGIVCFASAANQWLTWLWMLPVSFLGFFALGVALAVAVLWAITAPVDNTKPRENDSPFYRRLIEVYAQAILQICQIHVHPQGLEKVPKDGRFLLVCNHLSLLDPVILLYYFRKSQLAFISKQENSQMFAVGKAMHMILCQTLNRENDREALKTILRCIQLIKEDKVSIAVFPEGYTSRTGRLQDFRGGAFKVATKTGVPIVVCTLTNAHKGFHNAIRLRPTHVDLHLVDVIDASQTKNANTVELSDRIHAMMLKDLGPDYAPVEENS